MFSIITGAEKEKKRMQASIILKDINASITAIKDRLIKKQLNQLSEQIKKVNLSILELEKLDAQAANMARIKLIDCDCHLFALLGKDNIVAEYLEQLTELIDTADNINKPDAIAEVEATRVNLQALKQETQAIDLEEVVLPSFNPDTTNDSEAQQLPTGVTQDLINIINSKCAGLRTIYQQNPPGTTRKDRIEAEAATGLSRLRDVTRTLREHSYQVNWQKPHNQSLFEPTFWYKLYHISTSEEQIRQLSQLWLTWQKHGIYAHYSLLDIVTLITSVIIPLKKTTQTLLESLQKVKSKQQSGYAFKQFLISIEKQLNIETAHVIAQLVHRLELMAEYNNVGFDDPVLDMHLKIIRIVTLNETHVDKINRRISRYNDNLKLWDLAIFLIMAEGNTEQQNKVKQILAFQDLSSEFNPNLQVQQLKAKLIICPRGAKSNKFSDENNTATLLTLIFSLNTAATLIKNYTNDIAALVNVAQLVTTSTIELLSAHNSNEAKQWQLHFASILLHCLQAICNLLITLIRTQLEQIKSDIELVNLHGELEKITSCLDKQLPLLKPSLRERLTALDDIKEEMNNLTTEVSRIFSIKVTKLSLQKILNYKKLPTLKVLKGKVSTFIIPDLTLIRDILLNNASAILPETLSNWKLIVDTLQAESCPTHAEFMKAWDYVTSLAAITAVEQKQILEIIYDAFLIPQIGNIDSPIFRLVSAADDTKSNNWLSDKESLLQECSEFLRSILMRKQPQYQNEYVIHNDQASADKIDVFGKPTPFTYNTVSHAIRIVSINRTDRDDWEKFLTLARKYVTTYDGANNYYSYLIFLTNDETLIGDYATRRLKILLCDHEFDTLTKEDIFLEIVKNSNLKSNLQSTFENFLRQNITNQMILCSDSFAKMIQLLGDERIIETYAVNCDRMVLHYLKVMVVTRTPLSHMKQFIQRLQQQNYLYPRTQVGKIELRDWLQQISEATWHPEYQLIIDTYFSDTEMQQNYHLLWLQDYIADKPRANQNPIPHYYSALASLKEFYGESNLTIIGQLLQSFAEQQIKAIDNGNIKLSAKKFNLLLGYFGEEFIATCKLENLRKTFLKLKQTIIECQDYTDSFFSPYTMQDYSKLLGTFRRIHDSLVRTTSHDEVLNKTLRQILYLFKQMCHQCDRKTVNNRIINELTKYQFNETITNPSAIETITLALIYALQQRSLFVISALLSYPVKYSNTELQKIIPDIFALDDTVIMQLFLDKLPIRDLFQTSIYLPITIAVQQDALELLKLLTKNLPDYLNYKNDIQQNLMHIAAIANSFKVFSYLLEQKPEILTKPDSNGNTPVDLAISSNSADILFAINNSLVHDGQIIPDRLRQTFRLQLPSTKANSVLITGQVDLSATAQKQLPIYLLPTINQLLPIFLRKIDLSNQQLDDKAFASMSMQMPHLAILMLSLNKLSISAIAQISKIRTLTQLDLSHNPLKLAEQDLNQIKTIFSELFKNCALSQFSLANTGIDDKVISQIAQLLRLAPQLRWFDIADNQISHSGINILCDNLYKHPTINSLKVAGNIIDDRFLRSLKFLIDKNTQIYYLGLGGLKSNLVTELYKQLDKNKSLKDQDTKSDAVTVANRNEPTPFTQPELEIFFKENDVPSSTTSIEIMKLVCCHTNYSKISLVGIKMDISYLYELLAQNNIPMTLKSLELDRNELKPNDVFTLMHLLIQYNSQLSVLSISQNPIGNLGAIILGLFLSNNTSLTTLNLKDIALGDLGVSLLAFSLIKHPKLTALDVTSNKITTRGSSTLFKLVSKNPRITSLKFGDNDIQPDTETQLKMYTQFNQLQDDPETRNSLFMQWLKEFQTNDETVENNNNKKKR